MSMPDYNLLDEPWIPVFLDDGTIEKLGIKAIFERSKQIVDLACELPTQKIAVQRMLLAICYRVIAVRDAEEWERVWEEGLPTGNILEYLDRWRDRFFLFGGLFPFMQVHDLRTEKGTVSGLEKIIVDVPNGEPFFTTRHGRAIASISPDEAAIWLLHAHAYDPSGIRSGALGDSDIKGGKGYPIGPAWCGQTGTVWLRGDKLNETLVLNLIPHDFGYLRGPSPDSSASACTWEAEEPETAHRRDYSIDGKPEPSGIGIPRLLTWHSRRVRLHGDRSGVTGVLLAQGDKLGPQNMHLYEPLSLWRYSLPQSKKYKVETYMPRKHEPGRAFWRSLPSILPSSDTVDGLTKQPQQRFLRSATLQFHSRYTATPGRYPMRLKIEAIGMDYGSQEAVVNDIYHDEMILPSVLLKESSEHLVGLVDRQLRATEELAQAVGFLAANLARAAGEDGDGAGDGSRDRARELFFARIDNPFRQWVSALGTHSTLITEETKWRKIARRIAWKVASSLIEGVASSAIRGRKTNRGYISSAIAENYFNAALNKIMPVCDQMKGGAQ